MRDWLEKRRAPMPKPPPFHFLWNFRKRADTDRNILRAADAAMLWRSRPEMTRRRLAARYLYWVTRFPVDVVRAVAANGPATKRAFGRSLAAQTGDLWQSAIRSNGTIGSYYRFAAAYHDRRAPPCGMPFSSIANVLSYILLADLEPKDLNIQDKADFARHCRERDMPHPKIFGIVSATGLATLDGAVWDGSLPACDLFTKRARGGSGVGSNRWRYSGEQGYADTEGRVFQAADLLHRLQDQARGARDDILIQEKLVNHPETERLCGSAVPSIRVVSAWNESGDPEVVEGDLMVPSSDTSIASNIEHGGINYFLDYTSGRVREGYAADFVSNPVFVPNHPATGVRITGGTVPGWDMACRLSVEAHRTLPRHALIGWDIAYTPDGMVIMEANFTPLFDVLNVYEHRIGNLMAWHARRAIEKTEPPDSRWRVGADL